MTKYKKVTPEIAAQLQAIVGAKRFFAGDAVKDDFSHDEMPIYGKYYPEVVCEAESTEEVSAILRVCYENDIPVTPRGAGTGLVGGCVPLCGGVVLCTTRMNKILSYDMNNLVVHIQPGVLLCDLAADALTRGLMYPPDPGEKTATVGGNVSTNAGGMRAVKYGVTRDYVLAMTVVLPDGRVMELGKTVCKTSSGYSLRHLMIGSEGTLGVITELTLKLIPKPEMNVSLILPFADVETAIASVPQIKLANLDPQSIEFMERDIVDSSAAFTGNTIFPTVVDGKEAGAYILVTLVGDSEAELTAKMDRLGALAEQRGAYDTLVVWTDGLKKDVWAARSAFLTVIEADTKLLDEMDVVVPVDRIAEFLVYTRATGKAEGITIRSFGHAGDGNLHIYCCANDMELDEFKRRSKAVMDKCYAKCIEFGGQVSGEHAIGHAKKQYLVESAGETAFGLMQAIKQVPDINLVKMDPVTGSLIRAGVPAILNPLDANALEAAVRVKEAHGGTVTVITMGPDMAKEALRECLAAGADRAVLLSDRAFANADTLATSYVIASAAKQLGDFDLIFCGKESLDGATGQMGSQLAERFGASQISSTAKIVEVDTAAHTITAERDLERGTEVLRAKYPCLLTVEKANFRPRIPNLKRWKASRTADIAVYSAATIPGLDPAQIGDPGSPTKVPRTYPPEVGAKGSRIDEGSTEKNVDRLFGLIADVL